MGDFFDTYHMWYHWRWRHQNVVEQRNNTQKLYCYNGVLGENPHEIILHLSHKDFVRWEKHKNETNSLLLANEFGPFMEIIDTVTGEKWFIASAPCGSSCHCAAVAQRPI